MWHLLFEKVVKWCKNIKSDMDMLRSSGYRISESLYRQILL